MTPTLTNIGIGEVAPEIVTLSGDYKQVWAILIIGLAVAVIFYFKNR